MHDFAAELDAQLCEPCSCDSGQTSYFCRCASPDDSLGAASTTLNPPLGEHTGDQQMSDEPRDDETGERASYVWRVTKGSDGKVKLDAGDALSAYNPDSYLPIIGRALINLGTTLQRATVSGVLEDDDDEDPFE